LSLHILAEATQSCVGAIQSTRKIDVARWSQSDADLASLSVADAILGKTGKPDRLDTATRIAMDADFRHREPTTPAREPARRVDQKLMVLRYARPTGFLPPAPAELECLGRDDGGARRLHRRPDKISSDGRGECALVRRNEQGRPSLHRSVANVGSLERAAVATCIRRGVATYRSAGDRTRRIGASTTRPRSMEPRALVLVEAKAHTREVSRDGKSSAIPAAKK
jgi:hypothetical protein